jgi:hypothetical protein
VGGGEAVTYPIVRVNKALTDEEAEKLVKTFVDDRCVERVEGGRSVNVLHEAGPLFLLRHRVLKPARLDLARPWLEKAAKVSNNRGNVRSGAIGFWDGTGRDKFCAMTAFTRDNEEGWLAFQPLLRDLDRWYRSEAPKQYAAQRAYHDATDDGFKIWGTAFSTVTVNGPNLRFPVHRDKNNLKIGLAVTTVFRRGEYRGGHLLFPQYRIGADLREGDVLICDVNQLHGNSPFLGVEGTYKQVSLVAYYREKIIDCGTKEEEHEKAKRQTALAEEDYDEGPRGLFK